jgi:hypothetical protein
MASSSANAAGNNPLSNFAAKYPETASAVARHAGIAHGRNDIYFLFDADGTWLAEPPTMSHIEHRIDCDPITAMRIMGEHRDMPPGNSLAVIQFKAADGTTAFQCSYFAIRTSEMTDRVILNASDDVARGIACKAFYRERVDVSYNTGAPGIVGVINLRFSVLARECIDNMPDKHYCPHGDGQFELALTLLEQAKDAAVKAVILTNKRTAPKQ